MSEFEYQPLDPNEAQVDEFCSEMRYANKVDAYLTVERIYPQMRPYRWKPVREGELYSLHLVMSVLDPSDSSRKLYDPKVGIDLVLPILHAPSADVEGYCIPEMDKKNFLSLMEAFFSDPDGEFYIPTKREATKGLTSASEKIDAVKDLSKKITNLSFELWNTKGEPLKGQTVYARSFHNESKTNGETYVRWGNFSTKERALTPKDKMFQKFIGGVPQQD